jgi:hypothetical protein
MTSTITSSTTREQVVKKHPVRGAIWGLLLGFSLAVYAVLFAIIPFTDWVPLILVALVGVAIGVAWAYLAPAKQPKGGPPPAIDDRTSAADLDADEDATRPLHPSPTAGTEPDDDGATGGTSEDVGGAAGDSSPAAGD